jgi:hypothetical protein
MALKQQAGAGCTPVVDAEVSGDIEHAPTPDEQEEPGPPASLRPPSSAFAVVRASARGALVGRPERAPRRNRWGRPHPWDSGGGVRGRLAPEVLERARYSASADVLDGLDGLGYWR